MGLSSIPRSLLSSLWSFKASGVLFTLHVDLSIMSGISFILMTPSRSFAASLDIGLEMSSCSRRSDLLFLSRFPGQMGSPSSSTISRFLKMLVPIYRSLESFLDISAGETLAPGPQHPLGSSPLHSGPVSCQRVLPGLMPWNLTLLRRVLTGLSVIPFFGSAIISGTV